MWHEDDRAETLDLVAAEARACVITGGVLMRPTPGPAWMLKGSESEECGISATLEYDFEDFPEDQCRGDRRAEEEVSWRQDLMADEFCELGIIDEDDYDLIVEGCECAYIFAALELAGRDAVLYENVTEGAGVRTACSSGGPSR